MGRSRKDPHSPHRGNFCRPEGEKKLFLIIVNVLGHPKGVGGLTSNFLCGGGMDVFWNDPIFVNRPHPFSLPHGFFFNVFIFGPFKEFPLIYFGHFAPFGIVRLPFGTFCQLSLAVRYFALLFAPCCSVVRANFNICECL